MWFICSLRPAGSTPCLLPTTPHGVAVGSVFAAEPSNCTGGNFIRVDVRFTGALKVGAVEGGGGKVRGAEQCSVSFQLAPRIAAHWNRST